MACILTTTESGPAIVCARGVRLTPAAPCSAPGCGTPHSRLCDAPVNGRTCDAALCDTHAFRVGPDRDRCPAHTCPLCRFIVEDLRAHGRLTEDHPKQGPMMMNPLFPIHAKIAHLALERFAIISLDGTGRARILGVE